VVEADTVQKLIRIKYSKLSSVVEDTVCTVDTISAVLEPDLLQGKCPVVSPSNSVNIGNNNIGNSNIDNGFIIDHVLKKPV
jgi:hypothetical protein